MANHISKDLMFDNVYQAAVYVLPLLEDTFGFSGSGLFDAFFSTSIHDIELPEGEKKAKEHIRKSEMWRVLNELYDYAYDGILPTDTHSPELPDELVIHSAEILSMLSTENHEPSQVVLDIVGVADARYGLDNGDGLSVRQIAWLGRIDERTVRNAVSKGHLPSTKSTGGNLIDNASARRWLNERRGFVPTLSSDALAKDLSEVCSIAEFATFLVNQAQTLGYDNPTSKVVPIHKAIDITAIRAIESGSFSLPLDACIPLADYYHVDRDAFLLKVMELFFSDELSTIQSRPSVSKEAG